MQVPSPLAENKDIAHALLGRHGVCANLLALLVVGHLLFALYHQFVLKDNLLSRLDPRAQ